LLRSGSPELLPADPEVEDLADLDALRHQFRPRLLDVAHDEMQAPHGARRGKLQRAPIVTEQADPGGVI
jgi:hypothetical protein